MVKLYRGQVIEVWAPAGTDKNGNKVVKPRPVIVLQNVNKNANIVSVYCTTQNDGNDQHNILVLANSKEGRDMGLSKDTYIRPGEVRHLPIISLKRIMGKCSLMNEITRIIEKINMMGR